SPAPLYAASAVRRARSGSAFLGHALFRRTQPHRVHPPPIGAAADGNAGSRKKPFYPADAGIEPEAPTLIPSPQGGGRRKPQSFRSHRLPPPCGEGSRVGVGKRSFSGQPNKNPRS